ncbi:peptide deformylase [Candidatus Kaiserbacteria bacterium]|nr:peptide deformylase [Candidatus Kaiserbacteria bacterium]
MKEIVQDGAEVLREVAKPVPENIFGSAELARLINAMAVALDREPDGVALAAPQVGVAWRLFIVRKDRAVPAKAVSPASPEASQGASHPMPEIEVYVNPEIVKTSRRKASSDEGCLSVRGVYGVTKRHERVTIRARHPDGKPFTRGAGGIIAQIFEHEIDHLNGILFTDHAENLVHIKHAAAA